jgi:plasmid stabilization system protein ParE
MAKLPVEFHPEARAEYLAALSWYRERSPMAARNFEAALSRSVQQIRAAPERWAAYMKGCRRFLLHQFPFQIVYSHSPGRIVILAIAHAHRRPGYWKSRL